jgi:hypothetical protein
VIAPTKKHAEQRSAARPSAAPAPVE